MTIEQKCNSVLDIHSYHRNGDVFTKHVRIERWGWNNFPQSYCVNRNLANWSITNLETSPSIIQELIRQADLAECLTSPSEYIRECKKWFMENK